MRRIDWLAIVLLVSGIFFSSLLQTETKVPDNANPRRPAPIHFTPILWDKETKGWLATGPAKQEMPLLATVLPPDGGTIEDESGQSSAVGTAFSVASRGLWLTAKHVANGCSLTAIQTGTKKYIKVHKTILHPDADIALLQTKGAPDALKLATGNPSISDGFNIGFPRGEPGAVHSQFLGEMVVRHSNKKNRAMNYRERVNAWVEQSRVPDFDGSIGGISGGAVLGPDGLVIGIVQAGSTRRARVLTARPTTIQDMFKVANISYPSAVTDQQLQNLSNQNYPEIARYLLTTLRIAKVFCIVD